MSLHKLTAGSGYDYLTRQVAALDATDKGHTGLASYYTERGESPGLWVGSGMDGIDGLDVGDPVTAEQMRALFGRGLHPLAELRLQQLDGPDLTERDFRVVMRLGAPFKIIDDATPFRVEVAKRIAAAVLGEETGIRTDTLAKLTWSLDHGDLPDWATGVGPATLIIIDEAGMADTLSSTPQSGSPSVAGRVSG